jgi:hypothetical protein
MNGRTHFKTTLRRMRSALVFALGTICLYVLPAPANAADSEAVMPESQRVFFRAYCIACHNADKAEGKMRLDDIPFRISDVVTADRWQKVLGALNSGDMPPEGETQPPPEEKLVFLESLSKQMVVARKALADTGGTITLRRLNRREYVNTMRDLLDVEVHPLDLPSDESLGTFDTVGSGLFFSSDQFEQYLRLARAALDDAIVTLPRPERKLVRVECEEAANKQVRSEYERTQERLRKITEWRRSGKPAKEFGFGDDTDAELSERVLRGNELTALAYLNDPLTQTGVLTPHSPFPQSITIPYTTAPGRYVIRARVAFPTIKQDERRFIEFGTQGDQGYPAELRLLGCFAVGGTPERPEVVEVTVQVTRTGNRLFAIRERRHNSSDGADKQQFFAKLGVPMDTQQRRPFSPPPKLWVDWMEWEGPFVEQWPPRSHRAIFGETELGETPGSLEARQVIKSFAKRAFRGRTVRPEFVDRLVGHFDERAQSGESFFEAIKTPLSIVLASPKFLYILEPSEREPGDVQERSPQALVKLPDANKPIGKSQEQSRAASARVPLTNVELASRLSYFLWAGPPDERLMSYVEAGRLGEPGVLSGYANEVDRMLADPRANRFIAGFAHQWLHMTRLDFFQFNPRLYPKFDASLRSSARREVYETIRTLLDEDLPLGTLLKSDFVVVDDLLADYYGLGEMRGSAFRKVPVPEGTPRGGLLSMAAILAMGSDGERSSPVERGAWVLRKLLHDPPPPAPANVPQLSRFGDKLMPARELLLAHQEQAQCAQCHRRIDPIGFAMQNFDAAGLWRDEEYAEFFTFWKAIKKKEVFPIDPSGRLPAGPEFTGFFGLRDAVAEHEEDFVRGLIEHLIEYALGRPCGFSDAELVDTILKRAKSKGMTLREVIHALVESRDFLSK